MAKIGMHSWSARAGQRTRVSKCKSCRQQHGVHTATARGQIGSGTTRVHRCRGSQCRRHKQDAGCWRQGQGPDACQPDVTGVGIVGIVTATHNASSQ
jgi:hypothetical protein